MNEQRASLPGTIAAWVVAFLMVFPILWMAITAFKTESEAIAIPPLLLFRPVLSSFAAALAQSGYLHFALNSIIVSLGSTVLAILIAFPAAYAMAFQPGRHTQDLLVWMLSTKMLPPVGVLVPIYLIFRDAAHMDGVGPRKQMMHLLLPLASPGIASAALLAIILSWNEAFWSINLTAAHAGTLAAYIARYSAPEGLFWAKLSAASVLAVAPILLFGCLAQRRLVRGLTVGAVK